MNRKIRYSAQQKQENISKPQIEEFFESHNFITSPVTPDLGEDSLVRIYENGVSTGLSFYLQLKSTSNIQKHTLKSGEISYVFRTKDIDHWACQNVSVLLVIWDISQKKVGGFG